MSGKTKGKKYNRVIFPQEVIKKAEHMVAGLLEEKDIEITNHNFTIALSSGERSEYDEDEEELFFASYIKGFEYAYYSKDFNRNKANITFEVMQLNPPHSLSSEVSVTAPKRTDLDKVFNYLEQVSETYFIPKLEPIPEMPIIFIGHGHNRQWKDLKDHLHDMHGLEVKSYEIGPRARFSTKEILTDMLSISSFAVLVFTGEDQDADGGLHARENVIHELGLFQGRLGWEKAIVLLEDGVTEFSNIIGVNQIRFSKGHIRETFSDLIATIKRHFPYGW